MVDIYILRFIIYSYFYLIRVILRSCDYLTARCLSRFNVFV